MTFLQRLPRRLAIMTVTGAGLFALSLAGSPRLRAQTRITLQSLSDQITTVQTQVASVLSGSSPVGRYGYASGTDPQTAYSNTFVAIPNRTLNYSKSSSSSRLKITYSEQLGWASYSMELALYVDGTAVNARLLYNGAGYNTRTDMPTETLAIVSGLPAGNHTVTVQWRNPNFAPMYASQATSFPPTWYILVEELP